MPKHYSRKQEYERSIRIINEKRGVYSLTIHVPDGTEIDIKNIGSTRLIKMLEDEISR